MRRWRWVLVRVLAAADSPLAVTVKMRVVGVKFVLGWSVEAHAVTGAACIVTGGGEEGNDMRSTIFVNVFVTIATVATWFPFALKEGFATFQGYCGAIVIGESAASCCVFGVGCCLSGGDAYALAFSACATFVIAHCDLSFFFYSSCLFAFGLRLARRLIR